MTSIAIDVVNGARSSLAMKAPCIAATTVAITLNGEQTIDGVAVVTGDRVLVKNQASGVDNGIYVADTSDWNRAPDMDGSNDVTKGTRVAIAGGSVSNNIIYQLTTANPITIGTTSLTFTAVTGDSIITIPVPVAQGGTNATDAATARTNLDTFEDVFTTRGDMLRAGVAGAEERVALGASGRKMSSNGTDAVWLPTASTFNIENGGLAVTAAANAVTIALKGADGNDPSATNPVKVSFRGATGSGATTDVYATGALSLTIPNGATLGTTNNTYCRIWVGLILNAGAIEIAAYNAVSVVTGTARVQPLFNANTEYGIINTTIMNTSSDAAGTWYSTTARTDVPCAILGCFTTSNSTAGVWAAGIFSINVNPPFRPGMVVNDVMVETGAVATGATVMVNDDSIPQSGEGDQYMTAAFPFINATERPPNIIEVEAAGVFAASAANVPGVFAIFTTNSGVNAAAVDEHDLRAAGVISRYYAKHREISNQTGVNTVTARFGATTAGTVTFNGSGGARLMGGAMNSFLSLREISA